MHAPFGSNDPLVGFSATAANDAWAVGSYGQGNNRVAEYSHALAAHWNSRYWKITSVPNPPGGTNSTALVDVAAARPDDAWALGETQRLDDQGRDGISATGPVTYFLHWNGQNWQVTPGTTPPVYDGPTTVTAARDGSAWVIGNCYGDDFSLRWTGETWVTAPHAPDAHWRTNGPGQTPTKSRRGRPPSCATPAAAG